MVSFRACLTLALSVHLHSAGWIALWTDGTLGSIPNGCEPWMRPAQAICSNCWQLVVMANTVSDLFSVLVQQTRKEFKSPEFEFYVWPSPTSTTGVNIFFLIQSSGCNIYSIQMQSFGFFPCFCCFPPKLMRFNLQAGTEKAIEKQQWPQKPGTPLV